MTTLQTADGRLLRASRPAGASYSSAFPQSPFRPMWSDGETANTDDLPMASYGAIYASQPVVAAVVDKLARRIATLPFDGYERATGRGARGGEVKTGDSLDSLIRKPLARWSTVQLNHHVAQSILVHGNALLAKVRDTADREKPPVGLWPLDWSQVSAYAPQGGRIEWWSTTQFGAEERFIAVDDTVHFAWGNAASEIGVSPLQKLGVVIRIEAAAQTYQESSFKNGSRPGGIVTLPPGTAPSKEMLDLTRATIESMHKGPANAFKVGLVAPGADWKPMNQSAVEAELINQRYLDWEQVGMVYDMGGPLMNDFRRATFANVTELNKALYRDVVPPWTTLIEQTWQAQVLDTEPAWLDRFVAFDFADKLKGDPLELAETLKLQVEAGLITRNEARRILNMPPDGDPNDKTNPANNLTANVNNQAPIGSMGSDAGATAPGGGRKVALKLTDGGIEVGGLAGPAASQ